MNRGRLAGFLADSARFDAVLNTKAGTLDLPAVSFTTEWREGAPEGHPPPTAWRSFPTPRFERGKRLSHPRHTVVPQRWPPSPRQMITK